jgi:hypothetical protein
MLAIGVTAQFYNVIAGARMANRLEIAALKVAREWIVFNVALSLK